jgi:hypothetical protein
MRVSHRVLICSMVALFLFRSSPAAGEKWRVVVQDCWYGECLGVSDDGRFALAGTGIQRHVLHVVDMEAGRVVFTHAFPEALVGAAFSPDGERVAVSTSQSIFLVSLSDGSVEVLLDWTSGAVAFNSTGDLLAVLGNISEPEGSRAPLYSVRGVILPSHSGRGGDSTLGVFSIPRREWLHRTPTPVVIGHTVLFEASQVVAAGDGGQPYHMLPMTFPCHVILNVENGEVSTWKGPIVSRHGHERDPEEQTDYAPPRSIIEYKERRERASRGIHEIAREVFPQYAYSRSDGLVAGFGMEDSAHFAWVAPPFRALLTIHRDASIAARSLPKEHLRAVNGRLLRANDSGEKIIFEDLITGKSLFVIPKAAQTGHSLLSSAHFLDEGAIIAYEDRFSYFRPGSPEPIWTRPRGDSWWRIFHSADGEYLALREKAQRSFAEIRRVADGTVVSEIDCPAGLKGSWAYEAHFAPEADIVAVLAHNHLYVFDILSGNLVHETKFEEERFAWYRVCAVGQNWLLAKYDEARLYDPEEGWGQRFGIAEADRVQRVSHPSRDLFLIENSCGQGFLADPDSGTVLRSWLGSYHEDVVNRPPHAVPAFESRVLVRGSGHGCSMEILDLETLENLLTVRAVPVEGETGWIAFTPDGFWSSSPGTERYVEVFKDGKWAGDSAKSSRHRPDLVRERLLEAIEPR